MSSVIIKNSRWQALLLFAGSCAFVAGGVFMLLHKGHSLMGWAGVVFFGGCALIACWMLIDTRPRLVIDRRGIWDRTLGVGFIPWEDVQGAYLQSISGNDFICLELHDPNRYRSRLSRVRRAMSSANEALGFSDFSINLCGIAARTEEVFELVLKCCEASRLGEPSPEGADGRPSGPSNFGFAQDGRRW